jgi:hypothetical protein
VRQNASMSQEVVRQIVARLPEGAPRNCICPEALKMSLITERALIPRETLETLAPIVGKYLGRG